MQYVSYINHTEAGKLLSDCHYVLLFQDMNFRGGEASRSVLNSQQ